MGGYTQIDESKDTDLTRVKDDNIYENIALPKKPEIKYCSECEKKREVDWIGGD